MTGAEHVGLFMTFSYIFVLREGAFLLIINLYLFIIFTTFLLDKK